MLIRHPMKSQHPKDMTSWIGMQHNLILKLWTTQADSSWTSHTKMLSATDSLQQWRSLSATLSVYCAACSTSIQRENPQVQKTKLVSLNTQYQVPTANTALKMWNTCELQTGFPWLKTLSWREKKDTVERRAEGSDIYGLLH